MYENPFYIQGEFTQSSNTHVSNKKQDLDISQFAGLNLIENRINDSYGRQTVNPAQFASPFLYQGNLDPTTPQKKSCYGSCNGGKGCDGGADGKGCSGGCGSEKANKSETNNKKSSKNNGQNLELPSLEKALSTIAPDFWNKYLIEKESLRTDNFKIKKYNDYYFIQIGKLVPNNPISYERNEKNFSELKIAKSDGNGSYPMTTQLQKDGSLITNLIIENKHQLYIRYVESGNEGWVPDTKTQLTKKAIPYDTPLTVFNLLGVSTFVSSNLIAGTRDFKLNSNESLTNESPTKPTYTNNVKSKKEKDSSTQALELDENNFDCLIECPTVNGISQISHTMDCSLPKLFSESIITSSGELKLWAPCSLEMSFNVLDCCRQHDIDLWCSERRSSLDLFTNTKADDYILGVLKLLSKFGVIPGLSVDTILNIFDTKSAEHADLKVVMCVIGQVIADFLDKIDNDCWFSLVGGVLDIAFIIREILVGLVIAFNLSLFANIGHDTCLLGLGGRNRDSCLCGGPNPTTCCDEYFSQKNANGDIITYTPNIRHQELLNCFERDINGNFITVDGVPNGEDREMYTGVGNNDGTITWYKKKYLCGNEPTRLCRWDCVYSEAGVLISSTVNPDPLGLGRPCSNTQECNGTKCQNCQEYCEYDNNGKFIGKSLRGGNKANSIGYLWQNSAIAQCCKNSPTKTECNSKSPTWSDFSCSICWHSDITAEQKLMCKKRCGIDIEINKPFDINSYFHYP